MPQTPYIGPSIEKRKGLTMKGSITRDKKGWMVKYPAGARGKRIQKRCGSREAAERLLNALRYHEDNGTLDVREYLSDSPIAFDRQAKAFLEHTLKRAEAGDCKHRTWRTYSTYLDRAIEVWGDRSVRSIQTKDIEDLLDSYQAAAKSRANFCGCLRGMWTWMVRQDAIRPSDVPRFPSVRFQLGVRRTVTKATQAAILEDIREWTFNNDPKVWLGIKWLTTYVCLRPGDLGRIREEDIDRRNRVIWIRDPKAGEPYQLPLTKTDLEALMKFLPGTSDAPFFRHPTGGQYSEHHLYRAWKAACARLGVEGVDLYGGTRHSSVQALRFTHSPEQIRWATMHRTSRAFERYFRMSPEDLRAVYEEAEQCTTRVPPVSGSSEA